MLWLRDQHRRDSPAATPRGAPGTGRHESVGFIFVGPKDDYGYNQAAYQGSQAVKEAFPNLEVLTAENVPEDDNATRVMEGMIRQGRQDHLRHQLRAPRPRPEGRRRAPRRGRRPAGQLHRRHAARRTSAPTSAPCTSRCTWPASRPGKATKTNKLGYVYAFPIPQTIANINAFQLGAQSVNPAVKTYVVNTSNWCDPAKQAEAAKSLLAQGVDVITQHQDCTATVIKATEAAGAYDRRLPRRRLVARPEGLAHRLASGTGDRSTPTS